MRSPTGSKPVRRRSRLWKVDYEPQEWPAERLLRRMLQCSDIMPGDFYREIVEQLGLTPPRKQTYGSVATVLLDQWT